MAEIPCRHSQLSLERDFWLGTITVNSVKIASERVKVDLVEGDYGRLSTSLLEGFKEQNSL